MIKTKFSWKTSLFYCIPDHAEREVNAISKACCLQNFSNTLLYGFPSTLMEHQERSIITSAGNPFSKTWAFNYSLETLHLISVIHKSQYKILIYAHKALTTQAGLQLLKELVICHIATDVSERLQQPLE